MRCMDASKNGGKKKKKKKVKKKKRTEEREKKVKQGRIHDSISRVWVGRGFDAV